MIVEKVLKTKKGLYQITIDNKNYLFSEDTVVQFHLIEGHKTTQKEIDLAIKSEDVSSLFHKAVAYALKYGASEMRVRDYLKRKEVPYPTMDSIINRMKEDKILNDLELIDSLIESYAKKGNGRNLIKEKLYQKGFKKEDIEDRLSYMDMNTYKNGLIKLFSKVEHRYDKYDLPIRKEKLKAYLLSRGYTYSEIVFLF